MPDINKLKEKITSLPEAPGIYIFKDDKGQIIYVGKAKSLRKRVQSYFNRLLSSKTQALVLKIADIEHIVSPSEAQAQLLESSLIKQHQPAYNISLKDDKSFPLIRISNEDFPVVSICRRKPAQQRDGALYLGPYTNAELLRRALKEIRKIFGFRSCFKMPKKPCLYYRIKLCPAPCIGKISVNKYQEIIKEIKMFLNSEYKRLINRLSCRMREAAAKKKFEEAARIRDRISALGIMEQGRLSFSGNINELEDLRRVLNINKLPERIEAFDISNIFGREATGSMVSFYKGLADKKNYRHYRIKRVKTIDDYKMLAEVISRRYRRLIEEKLMPPDLILIDGGRSHLLTAYRQIRDLKLNIFLASIAKDKENVYILGKLQPIRLIEGAPALNLIRRIRDEAHRFALKYHHILRRKGIIGK
jgi:excinuclease ABC subunit C